MARLSSLSSFRSILADIRAGKFAPIYILHGEESYFIDRLTEALESHVVKADDAAFNADIFYGADTQPLEVTAAAKQFPMMAPLRLVMYKETQSMDRAKQQLDKLLPYFENPNEQTVLVVTYKGDAISSSSKLVKAAQKSKGIVFSSPRIRDYEMQDTIRDLCLSEGINLDSKAASLLADNLGTDLTKVAVQIKKLTIGQVGKPSITSDMVAQKVGVSKEFNNFELIEVTAKKDYAKAMLIAEYFRKNPKSNPLLVTSSTLFGFFAQVLVAHYAQDKTDDGLRSLLDIKGKIALNRLRFGMRNYSPGACVNIIHYLRLFDAQSKGRGSYWKDSDLFKELLFKIFTS